VFGGFRDAVGFDEAFTYATLDLVGIFWHTIFDTDGKSAVGDVGDADELDIVD